MTEGMAARLREILDIHDRARAANVPIALGNTDVALLAAAARELLSDHKADQVEEGEALYLVRSLHFKGWLAPWAGPIYSASDVVVAIENAGRFTHGVAIRICRASEDGIPVRLADLEALQVPVIRG